MKHFRKYIAGLMLALTLSLIPANALAAGGFKGEKFQKIVYLFGPSGKGSASGLDAGNAKAFADGDLWAIPAGTVIEKVYVVVDTAITGTTNFDVGDDDDADGYIDGSASVTLGTPGMYGWDNKLAGAYLKKITAGATDAGDVYVVPDAKYYSATGKEVKLDITTTNTAGAARVIIEGFYLK